MTRACFLGISSGVLLMGVACAGVYARHLAMERRSDAACSVISSTALAVLCLWRQWILLSRIKLLLFILSPGDLSPWAAHVRMRWAGRNVAFIAACSPYSSLLPTVIRRGRTGEHPFPCRRWCLVRTAAAVRNGAIPVGVAGGGAAFFFLSLPHYTPNPAGMPVAHFCIHVPVRRNGRL